MALMHCHFSSQVLGLATSLYAIIPQRSRTDIGIRSESADTQSKRFAGHRTLYLLHGFSDDHTIWERRTAIDRYAHERGVAVIMPEVGRSFYTDMAEGMRYWEFISEEVPAVAREFFHLSARREDQLVAGNSMGGYGAIKLALAQPERWGGAVALSGALDIAGHVLANRPEREREWQRIFGEDLTRIRGSSNDLFHLADQLVGQGISPPRLAAWCGRDDFLYEDNRRFRDHARQIGLPLDFREHPGEGHTWGYWDQQIAPALDWLLGKDVPDEASR